MLKTEERVDKLETLLGEFIVQTKTSLLRLESEMKDFKDEMREFKSEMKDFKVQAEKDRININKQWADLAFKMGTIVEDIVVPNIDFIARKYFNLDKCLDFMIRRQRKMPSDNSKEKEFDIIAVYESHVLLNETKSTPRLIYAKDYVNFIKSKIFFKYFPEYSDKKLIPILSSIYIPKDIVKYLSKNKIFAMGMKEEIMDLINPEFK